MKFSHLLIFGAGVALGAGAVCAVQSKMGKKFAVAVVGKGLELKERLAYMADRMKESVEDIVAEARYVNEHGTSGEGAES